MTGIRYTKKRVQVDVLTEDTYYHDSTDTYRVRMQGLLRGWRRLAKFPETQKALYNPVS